MTGFPSIMLHGRSYGGWHVRYVPSAPITGRWKAVKQGVEVCAGTTEVLAMILRLREKTDA